LLETWRVKQPTARRTRGAWLSATRGAAAYLLKVTGIGVIYFVLAKGGLQLASVNPSATPIWAPTGVALAAVLLGGYRVWPGIVVAAFLANAITAGSIYTSGAIAVGNGLEAVIGGWLINRWAEGRDTFATPTNVAKFTLIAVVATMISATVGVGALSYGGYADWARLPEIWMTWWLGDLTGALIVAPLLVLWAARTPLSADRGNNWEFPAILASAVAIGLVAFSPVVPQTAYRDALGFVAVLPLLWAALRRNQRDTATVVLILVGFAVWGTAMNTGPFARAGTNDAFLALLMFLISISVPSLALSADVATRRRSEDLLRRARNELEETIRQRTAALAEEIQQRRQLEVEFSRGVDVRRRTEEALVDSERHFRMLVEGVTDYAIFMLDPNGRITSWNSGAQRIKGYAPEQIIGQHFSQFYTDEDRKRGEPERSLQMAAEKGKYESEGWRVRRDGSVFWASIAMDAIRDDRGTLIGFAKVTRDITEKRNAGIALDKVREELAQAQKMEAMGQLTGGIAHDFNNLLMVVSGHVQILQQRLADPKIAQATEAIHAAAKRGENLTRQLLAFSRREPLNPTAVNLRARVDALEPIFQSSLRGNITITYDIPNNIWPIEVDVAELELALLNIAINSRDAMPNGGTFAVSARNISSGENSLPAPLHGEFVALELRDSGMGIPAEIRSKIFDPFFTTKAVGKGTGLGLSQVYGFAHNAGGTVTVASQIGEGASITIYLPRSAVEATPTVDASAEAIAAGQGTILMVEDNAEVSEVTSSLLEQLGYRVVHAITAEDALETLADGAPIDLVFSDIVMPGGMSGLDLARAIRTRHSGVPVVLTTGYSDTLQGIEGEFVVLRKPFEMSVLARSLRDALALAQ
jgi:PAS domain S-box-containing protein